MQIRFFYFLLFLFSIVEISNAQTNHIKTEIYSKVKIYITGENDIREMLQLGISLDHMKSKIGHDVELILNSNELELLQNNGWNFEILIHDMEKFNSQKLSAETVDINEFDRLKHADGIQGYTLGSMGGFHTRDEAVSIYNYLHNQYPNIVSQLMWIGMSHEGINMYAVRISDNPNVHESDEGVVYYDALIHAREPMSLEVLLYYTYWLVENYGTDPEATYLINNRQIYIVPVVNPDGYLYNEINNPNGGGMWRKNRRNNGSSYGVDLNRNYGYQWGYDNIGSSSVASSETYRGPSAFSEPETQAVRDFIFSVNPSIGFNVHSVAGHLINPYGYSGLPVEYNVYAEFGSDMGPQTGYVYGTTPEVLGTGYVSNGTARDWMHHDAHCYAWTPEIDGSGFWPSQNEIVPLNSQFMPALKYTTWVSGNFADYQSFSPVNNSSAIPGDTLTFYVDIKNRGLSLTAQNVSVQVSTQNANVLGIVTQFNFDSIAVGQIKNNINHPFMFLISELAQVTDEIKFQVNVLQDGVLTSEDEINFVVGEPQILFSDKGENGTQLWQSGGTAPGWDTTYAGFFSQWHSFADSRMGNYTNNMNSNYSMKNVINLTTTENPRLEYYAKWIFEKIYDYARIEISTNNGQTWFPISGRNTQNISGQPGYGNLQKGWAWESIDLTPYKNYSVRFRFTLYSDSDIRGDGFYFDDFRIVDYRTPVLNSVDENIVVPGKFVLFQNFPNPFNPITQINYQLPELGLVNISVYNTLGQKIKTLVNKNLQAGKFTTHWDGTNQFNSPAASGIYYFQLEITTKTDLIKQRKKCLLLR